MRARILIVVLLTIAGSALALTWTFAWNTPSDGPDTAAATSAMTAHRDEPGVLRARLGPRSIAPALHQASVVAVLAAAVTVGWSAAQRVETAPQAVAVALVHRRLRIGPGPPPSSPTAP
jgi:hypothetical protein